MNDLDGITRILGNLSNNIYLVESDDELVVFDPGMPSDIRRLTGKIKSLGRSPEEVTAIVLTHFHVDHAGSAAALKDASGATVYLHTEDTPYLQGEKSMPSVYKAGVQGRALMVFPRTVEKYSRVPPVDVDVPFKDGDVLPVLGGLKVYHSPGHTPGSSCFLWRDRAVLFTGDAIQNLYLFLTLPEAGFSYDVKLAGRSAAAVVDALAAEDYRVICTGHGPIVRGSGREKMARFGAGLRKRGKA
jgi:glyoxylase-like metal-dependent hydrolase (beta-lactamase superfamily II)